MVGPDPQGIGVPVIRLGRSAIRFVHRPALPLALLITLTAADHGSRLPVWGHIVDEFTGAPVVDAVVRMRGAEAVTRTDARGRFDFGPREFGRDTLSVTHESYRSAQIYLGGLEATPIDVRLSPNALPIPDGLASSITSFAASSGGRVWRQENFWRFLARSAHPLDLLLSSGMVDALDDRRGPGTCVVLAGAEGCATLWLHDSPVANNAFDRYLPTQVAGFVVVPEGAFTRSLGPAATPDNGLVVVFMLPAS